MNANATVRISGKVREKLGNNDSRVATMDDKNDTDESHS